MTDVDLVTLPRDELFVFLGGFLPRGDEPCAPVAEQMIRWVEDHESRLSGAAALQMILKGIADLPEPVRPDDGLGHYETCESACACYKAGLRQGLGAYPKQEGPLLGLATTRQLLEEITTRIMVDGYNGGGGLDYRTVNDQ